DDGYGPLRDAGIDPGTGLGYCQNDEEFYRSILADYARSADEKSRSMTGFFGAADWKNYAILVHALKSTSKTIGAAELSALAAKLEAAANAGDGDTILAGHETMMRMYASVAGAIAEALPEAVKPAEAEGTSGEDEALEFLPDEDGALEFTPDEDEVLEFVPEQ
ncbi:MAG: Hpt domain-containing protein, partial [Firmicutes bacterium]|nr:Hpt domain-containing protein [Bacillota bacterium]